MVTVKRLEEGLKIAFLFGMIWIVITVVILFTFHSVRWLLESIS